MSQILSRTQDSVRPVLRLSLLLEIMATRLKTNHTDWPRRYAVVRLSTEILCLPSPASFVTICFAFRSRILPSSLPRFHREEDTRARCSRNKGTSLLQALSFLDFQTYNGCTVVVLDRLPCDFRRCIGDLPLVCSF